MTLRYSSGRYLLRSVPIEGKYMPTIVSKAKNEAQAPMRAVGPVTVVIVLTPVATTMAIAARERAVAVRPSTSFWAETRV